MPGINMNAAVPGISRLAQAMGGGPTGAYQKAYDNQLGLQSRLAQAMAAIEASGATADLNRAKTDSERAEQAMRTPEAIRRTAMTANGIPLDEADSVDSFLKTGHLAGKYDLDPAQQGPTMPAPDWASKLGEVARAMAGSQRALTIGDKSSENIAKAGAIERGERLSDDIIAGRANRNTVGGAQAAAKGDALFSTDSTGSVLDRFTGNLATDNPMAGSTINLRNQQAGQAKAAAAENFAQADSARATAAKTKADAARDVKSADIVQVTRPDGSVWLVNKVNGLARPVVDAAGNAVDTAAKGGKAGAGKVGGGLKEHEAKANLFGSRMKESDRILTELEGKYSPMAVNAKMGAEELPLIGGVAGPLANVMLSDEGQKVEQAQRDFLNAVLRRESGAVINPDEFRNGKKQYFPQPGDSQPVIEQKRRNRELAIRGMEVEVPGGFMAPAAAGSGPKKIASDAEYEALPSGAEFIAPDGSHRRKP